MRVLGEVSGQRVQPFSAQRTAGRSTRPLQVVAAAEVKTSPAKTAKPTGNVYVGKGRWITDDDKKYPSKDDIGVFSGATGGWAGGEAGLQQFIDEVKKNGPGKPAAKKPAAPGSKSVTVPATGKAAPLLDVTGDDLIYIGYGKDDLDARKSGVPGAFIKADARKFPSKESIGPLVNVAGGFAGGELGVQQFADKGEIEILTEGKRRRGQSPLIVAGIVAVVGTVGGLSLEKLTDFSEQLATNGSQLSALDDNTKLLLEAAIITLGAAAALAGTRAALKQMTEDLSKNLLNIGKISIFWIIVFLAARFVLET